MAAEWLSATFGEISEVPTGAVFPPALQRKSSTGKNWENGKRVPLPFLVKRLVEMKEELDSRDTRLPWEKMLK